MFRQQSHLHDEEIKQLSLQQLYDGQFERGRARDLNISDPDTEEEHGDQEHATGAGESPG